VEEQLTKRTITDRKLRPIEVVELTARRRAIAQTLKTNAVDTRDAVPAAGGTAR
jgi:hypothetical protein